MIIYRLVCFSLINIVRKLLKNMLQLLLMLLIKLIHNIQHLEFLVMNQLLVSFLRLYYRHKWICTKSELSSVECVFEKLNLHRTLYGSILKFGYFRTSLAFLECLLSFIYFIACRSNIDNRKILFIN